jgi:thiol-disulfide isomerase/thioredoxin
MKAKQLAALLIGFGLLAPLARAAEPTLKVGDKAPKLQVGKWVQGEGVKDFQPGKAYLVEFWATWCGPCRVSIPHLNELHNKYKGKGLIVIGQDCWERDENLVGPFIEKMGEKMSYRVALDDKTDSKKGKMADTWMEAAGRRGIPSAFLVDTKGVIAWIGHPMQLKEEVIEQVLAGKFNIEKAAAEYDSEQQMQAKLNPVLMELNKAVMEKDWAAAETSLADADKLMPANRRGSLDLTRFTVLVGKKDYPAAYEFASKVASEQKENAMLQNEIAWKIVSDVSITNRNLEVAETLARQANTALKGKDPAILDTLARVKFLQGKKDEAIAFQQQAVNLSEGNAKAGLQTVLESYKRGDLSQAR